MKFADANIFLYAFLEPKKKMAGKQSSLRQESKNIVTRIEKGERVITSVVQLSEISNILEARTSRKFSREIMESMLLNENIRNLLLVKLRKLNLILFHIWLMKKLINIFPFKIGEYFGDRNLKH